MSFGYYDDKLSANRLKQCYDLAPPRIQQYLKTEIGYVCEKIKPGDIALELGCGYGRIIPDLAKKASFVVGIDTSHSSLFMGKEMLYTVTNLSLLQMDAVDLAFRDQSFNAVVCIQNGISAFHVDKLRLLRESMRVTQRGGIMLFSSYSDKFWNDRLEWFQLQAEAGLLGKIDMTKTEEGSIVCEDGFTATTVGADEFRSLSAKLDVKSRIEEVDRSSLFCEMIRE